MSTNFNDYSSYYDLLYSDKNYPAEVEYLITLAGEHSRRPVKSILELGCGTGIHASLMAFQGFKILGVDLSSEMLEVAKARAKSEGFDETQIAFAQGDARSFRSERRFDVVASLFHVLSYQTIEADLQALMQTAAVHLDADGLFIFDFWYGPAVLWQRPVVRVKRLNNDQIEITRLAEPVIHDAANTVDVNYTVHIKNIATEKIEEIKETHRMRFLFLPEIDLLLDANGFDRVSAEEWLSRKSPSLDTWGICVIARKK
jgi:SAM-dependent methyltransferase